MYRVYFRFGRRLPEEYSSFREAMEGATSALRNTPGLGRGDVAVIVRPDGRTMAFRRAESWLGPSVVRVPGWHPVEPLL